MNPRYVHFLALLTAATTINCAAQASLVAYWSFDEYNETGDNPPGTPQGNHEGWFEDLSGNGHKAYAADLTNANLVPLAPGRTGNAFYSKSPTSDAQRGAMAVVQHTDLINFDAEDFTISFWEKVAFRDVAGSGWAPGRGRTQWFMKAPHLPAGAVGEEGYGLNLPQNHFDFLTNNTDNFGQTSLGVRFTYPPGSQADDSAQWTHWAITGTFNAGSDDYTMAIYLNGVAVDWNGATGTTFTVPADTIDNDGDLTLGGFFRNDGWAHQRFISWNMSSGGAAIDGEGWMDDFAMWSVLLTEDQIGSLADGSADPLTVLGGAPPFDFNEVTLDAETGNLSLSWDSQDGKLYNLRSETDPSSTTSIDWPIFDDGLPDPELRFQNIGATPPTNTLTIPLPPETIRLFVVEEFPAPPVTVFTDNFENGQGDWTTGGDDGSNPFTNWEFGSPTVVGPASANSGANCFGTNLSADYANLSDLWLRSPPIDLTAAAGATLNFSHYVDIEEGFDFGEVRLLDADAALAELTVLEMTIDGNNPTGWEPFSKALPAAALGKNVVLEFRFDSDDISEPTQAGWYIDDVVVTTPAP